jgi:hypothetical protein
LPATKNLKEVKELFDAQKDGEFDPARIARQEGIVDGVNALLERSGLAPPAHDETGRAGSLDRVGAIEKHLGRDPQGITASTAKSCVDSIHDVGKAPKATNTTPVAAPTAAAVAAARLVRWARPLPAGPDRTPEEIDTLVPEFRSRSADELAQENCEWVAAVEEWVENERQLHDAAAASGLPPPAPTRQKPSPPLNDEQRAFCRKLLGPLLVLADARKQHKSRDDTLLRLKTLPMLHLLHGPAGAGKSEIVNCLKRVMLRLGAGNMASAAYTGVATTQLTNAFTINTLFRLPVTCQSTQQDFDHTISADRRVEFEERVGNYDDLSVLVLDEVSLISATLLHHMDMRLRALLHCDAEFGGLLVICAGDFHQLPPVGGTGLIKSLLDLGGRKVLTGTGKISGAKSARSSLRNPLDAAYKGAEKFARFRLSGLKRSMRSRTDPVFTRHLMAMRDVSNPQPVSTAFLQELERHTAPEQWDGKMQFGVRLNREGDALNAACAARFAEMHDLCLVRWRLPVTGLGQRDFSDEALEVLYQNEPGLWGYFVVGAPALYMNVNVSTVCGVVNGADCRMHSLTMPEGYWARSATTRRRSPHGSAREAARL